MRKTPRRLTFHKESLRNLTGLDVALGGASPRPSIDIGCTSEYTWYCPTQSPCSVGPACRIGVD
jgi:hypothetical protein